MFVKSVQNIETGQLSHFKILLRVKLSIEQIYSYENIVEICSAAPTLQKNRVILVSYTVAHTTNVILIRENKILKEIFGTKSNTHLNMHLTHQLLPLILHST